MKGRETSVQERNIDWLPSTCVPTGDGTHNQAHALAENQPGDLVLGGAMWALYQLSPSSQGSTKVLCSNMVVLLNSAGAYTVDNRKTNKPGNDHFFICKRWIRWRIE